jgi:hypothetical protein
MSDTIDRTVRLSPERAQRLAALAAQKGVPEEALILDAVDLLLRLGPSETDEQEREAWIELGADAMYRVWDNEDDAVYDNWREIYGIQSR